MVPIGINEYSREGAPIAQATAKTKAPKWESEQGMLLHWWEFVWKNTNMDGRDGPQKLDSKSNAVAEAFEF